MTARRQVLWVLRSVLGLLLWLALVVLTVKEIVLLLGQLPIVMTLVLVAVGLVASWATIIAVGYVIGSAESWLRGYQLRAVDGPIRARILGVKHGDCFQWFYEETSNSSNPRKLRFVRAIVGRGYPAPNEVCLPSVENWDRKAPAWAIGRRSEIIARIVEAFGRNTVVVDEPS